MKLQCLAPTEPKPPSPLPSPRGRKSHRGPAGSRGINAGRTTSDAADANETSGPLSSRPPLSEGEGLGVRGKTGHWASAGSHRPSRPHYTGRFLPPPTSRPDSTANE